MLIIGGGADSFGDDDDWWRRMVILGMGGGLIGVGGFGFGKMINYNFFNINYLYEESKVTILLFNFS